MSGEEPAAFRHRWMDAVARNRHLSHGAKHVLQVLGRRHMRNHRASAWPSLPTLAADAGMSRPTLTKLLAEAEERQWLSVTRGGGRKKPNIYHAEIPNRSAEDAAETGNTAFPVSEPIQKQESAPLETRKRAARNRKNSLSGRRRTAEKENSGEGNRPDDRAPRDRRECTPRAEYFAAIEERRATTLVRLARADGLGIPVPAAARLIALAHDAEGLAAAAGESTADAIQDGAAAQVCADALRDLAARGVPWSWEAYVAYVRSAATMRVPGELR